MTEVAWWRSHDTGFQLLEGAKDEGASYSAPQITSMSLDSYADGYDLTPFEATIGDF